MNSKSREADRGAGNLNDIVKNLVDNLDAMLAYWDKNQVCNFANAAYRSWFGKSGNEVIGMTMEQLLGPLYIMNLPYIQAALAGKVQVFEREIPTPDGRIRHSLATYTPHIVDGQVEGIFVHVADVTPLKLLERELRAAKAEAERTATHDFLTGLTNRVMLQDRLSQALAQARRTGNLVAAVSLDLDNFKLVNDTHGHTGGDKLLIQIASRIKHSIRDGDTAIRMGGDEFFLVLPEMESVASIESMVNRILENIRLPVQVGAATINPTVSVGIAISASNGVTPESLIDDSDRALYQAKSLGKNRYAIATQAR